MAEARGEVLLDDRGERAHPRVKDATEVRRETEGTADVFAGRSKYVKI